MHSDTRLQSLPFHQLTFMFAISKAMIDTALKLFLGSCHASATNALHKCRLAGFMQGKSAIVPSCSQACTNNSALGNTALCTAASSN